MSGEEFSAGLEDRVVAALRAEGALPPRSARRHRLRLAAAAAVILAATAWGSFTLGQSTAGAAGSGGKYLLLLYGAASASASEEEARFAEYSAWAGRLSAERRLDAAERLGPAARVAGPPVPGLGDAQQPLGFFLVRAASFDAAAAIAADCPHVRHGGTVVVRQVE
jgi:hypothetical protein